MSLEDRDRLAAFRDALDRRMSGRGISSHGQLVQVYDGGSIPTAVPRMFLSRPAGVDVDETEGATPSISPDTDQTIPVLVLGPQVPAAGDNLLASVVGGRWVAGMQGGASSCLVTICVTGCSRSLLGATVQVKSGSTVVASGTTDATGCVTLDVGSAGTYTVVVAATNFNTNTASRSLTCGDTTNVSLTVASGHSCTSSACCPGMANTLYVTDSLGTTTLTLDNLTTWDGNSLPGWFGTGIFTKSNISVFTIVGLGSQCVLGTDSIQVYYQLFCRGSTSTTSTWSLERYWGEGHTDTDGTGWYYGTGLPGSSGSRCVGAFGPGFSGPQAIGSATITKATSCSPFAVSGSTTSSQNHLSDPGGGVFSVSE